MERRAECQIKQCAMQHDFIGDDFPMLKNSSFPMHLALYLDDYG